jgi:hypothetical protein
VGVERPVACVRLEDYYEERVARYLELADAAEEAAGRASSSTLQETYIEIARQWAHLAQLAEGTRDLALQVSTSGNDDARQQREAHARQQWEAQAREPRDASDKQRHEAHDKKERQVN